LIGATVSIDSKQWLSPKNSHRWAIAANDVSQVPILRER